MRVDSLLDRTPARLEVIAMDATLSAAIRALSNPQIVILVVCDKGNRAAGVIAASDVVAYWSNDKLAEASVATLMTREIVLCAPEDDVNDAWKKMAALAAPRALVVNAAREPVGVLDARDALSALLDEQSYQQQILMNYVRGIGYQ